MSAPDRPSASAGDEEAGRQGDPPRQLYVSLDGALLPSDSLWEAALAAVRASPGVALGLPFWRLAGRAVLRDRLADRALPDVTVLPYRAEVVRQIEQARSEGRRVVLVTSGSETMARAVSTQTGLFDDVMVVHAAGRELERRTIESQRAVEPFELLTRRDAVAWSGTTPLASVIWRALRPHQWLKNGLLFVPLLLAHEFGDVRRTIDVSIAFVCFCAVASAMYLLNDLLDIDSDRHHPTKRRRPFAAAELPIPMGLGVMAALLVLGTGSAALALGANTTAMLLLYLALTTAYSYAFKERLFVDVLLLAGLYVHRVLTGAVAAEVPASPWLLAFAMFFFLSLAFVKRYAELLNARDRAQPANRRRAYEIEDVGLVETMGLASGYLAVLVVGLFVTSDAVRVLYPRPEILWLMCPVMLYWITRLWFLARRGLVSEDAVLFAISDRASYVAGAIILGAGVVAAR